MSSRPVSALPWHLAHFWCCGLCLPSAQAHIEGLQSPSSPKNKASTATLHFPYTLQVLVYMANACPQPGHPARGINAHSPPCPKPTQHPQCILHCVPPPSGSHSPLSPAQLHPNQTKCCLIISQCCQEAQIITVLQCMPQSSSESCIVHVLDLIVKMLSKIQWACHWGKQHCVSTFPI